MDHEVEHLAKQGDSKQCAEREITLIVTATVLKNSILLRDLERDREIKQR